MSLTRIRLRKSLGSLLLLGWIASVPIWAQENENSTEQEELDGGSPAEQFETSDVDEEVEDESDIEESADESYGEDGERRPAKVVREADAARPRGVELDSEEVEKLRIASSRTIRQFHEVLNELLAEFGFDVRKGQLKGLKNLAIRRVKVNDALPQSYRTYLETLVSERVRENSQMRLINCVACRTKTSIVADGKLLITSPATNLAQMNTAALQLGIENFMDIVLVYHTTHMVLAFKIFDVETKETVWARSYNSETIRSRFQKLAVDYKQVEVARDSDEYEPEYRTLFGFGGAALPNVGGTADDSRFINLQFRATEKFDNRNSEFGLLFSLLVSVKTILKDHPTVGADPAQLQGETEELDDEFVSPKPFGQAFMLHGIYSRNFLGSVESYNEVRHGLHVGAGFLLAVGYLAPSVRGGWDIFFGKRFVASLSGLYITPSTILIQGQAVPTAGGAGGDVTLSFNF